MQACVECVTKEGGCRGASQEGSKEKEDGSNEQCEVRTNRGCTQCRESEEKGAANTMQTTSWATQSGGTTSRSQ